MEQDRDYIEADCRNCKSSNAFDYVYCYEHQPDDGCPEEYTIARCRACNEIAFFYREDPDFVFEQTGEIAAFHCLWPDEPRFLDFELPELIGDSYTEAVRAVKAKLYVAAGAMIGRTVEAICKDFDPKCKGIYAGLRSMLKEGALSQEMYDWANELRVLRNESAHATDIRISKEEADSALDFLQSILELIYEIRPKFEQYSQYRAANKQSKADA